MSVSTISLLLPTRARPKLVERFFQSVLEQTAYPEAVEIILYIDDDDIESHGLECSRLNIKKIIGERITMGGYNSRCLGLASGEIIVLVNDDMVIRSKGWDERLRRLDESIPDGVYLAYGNDLFKGGRLCTFPILSRKCCDLLIDPYPVEYRGAFIDYHLMDIFKRLECEGVRRIHYLEDVVFEHLHFRAGKSEVDATYTQRGRFADDGDFLALIGVRQNAARRLALAINERSLLGEGGGIADRHVPSNMFAMAWFLTQSVLFDRGLPIRWRFFLWYWFLGRHMAARGLLRPFVN